MEIINYKGIITIDDFITPEENKIIVATFDPTVVDTMSYYWRLLINGNLVTPLSLTSNKGFYQQISTVPVVAVNLALSDIITRITDIISSPKLKVESCIIEKHIEPVPYYSDSEWPALKENQFLGVPLSGTDNSAYVGYNDKWVSNYVGTRLYSSHIFLNDDLEGGNIAFPQHEFDVAPKANRLVLFPSNHNYVHGSRPMGSSRRMLTTWFEKYA